MNDLRALTVWRASSLIGAFFLLVACSTPDSQPPVTSILSPASGSPVSGTVSVQVSASDDLTVETAETFFVGEGQWLVHNVNCPTIVSRTYKPNGNLNVLPGRYSQSEMDAAVRLAHWGNDVTIRSARGQGRLSDLLVNGIPYDVYTPQSGTSVDNILRAIFAKDSQAQGVVLDLRNVGNIGYTEAGFLTRVQELGARNIADIVFIGGGR